MTDAGKAFATLPQDAADAYSQLGIVPITLITAPAVAAVSQTDQASAAQILAALADAGLLTPAQHADVPDGHLVPENVRGHARTVSTALLPHTTHVACKRRWCEWLLHVTTATEALLTPSHRTLPRTYIYASPPHLPFATDTELDALRWLDAHLADLLTAIQTACCHEWFDLAWQLCDAAYPLFWRRRHIHDSIDAYRTYGLPAARKAEEPAAVRRMLTVLAGALRNQGQHDEALRHLKEALALARRDGDPRDEAQALHEIGAIHHRTGQWDQAATSLHEALDLRTKIDYRRGAALTRILLGNIASRHGDHTTALRFLQLARNALIAEVDRHDAARALAFLGRHHSHTDSYDKAVQELQQAGEEFAATGSPHWHARTREWLGEAAQQHGRNEQARRHFTEAREMYAAVGSSPDIARLDQQLRDLDRHV